MHAYIHQSSIHTLRQRATYTYTHTYIHAYIYKHKHNDIQAIWHTYIHTYIHTENTRSGVHHITQIQAEQYTPSHNMTYRHTYIHTDRTY